MARAIGVDRSIICRWRRVQGFQEWVTRQCTAQRRGGLEQILNRALELGLKGSIEHMEFYAKYSGEVEPGILRAAGGRSGDAAVALAGYVINTLVPRPEPLPLSLESGMARPKLPSPGSALVPTAPSSSRSVPIPAQPVSTAERNGAGRPSSRWPPEIDRTDGTRNGSARTHEPVG